MGRKVRLGLKLEERVDRYAESALISAIRLRRYWLSQGKTEGEAIEMAVKQAVGMMVSSGAPISRLVDLFTELEKASGAFKQMLLEVSQKHEDELKNKPKHPGRPPKRTEREMNSND
jgi:hypothetical protein